MADCKYYKYQRYISRDNGQTWSPMNEYQKGGLYESYSEDCGYEPQCLSGEGFVKMDITSEWICDVCPDDVTQPTIYKWTETTDTICVDFSTYKVEKYQVSHDLGDTWEDVSPLKTRTGQVVTEGLCNN